MSDETDIESIRRIALAAYHRHQMKSMNYTQWRKFERSAILGSFRKKALVSVFRLLILLALLQLSAMASHALFDSVGGLIAAFGSFAFILAPLVLVETIWPASAAPRHYLRGLAFWIALLLANYAWAKVAVWLVAWTGLYPLVKLHMAAGIMVWILAYDFFYYWLHRAEHHYPALWRIHRLHHSIEHVNCLNSYHHVFEGALRIPFVVLPLAFFLQIDAPQLFLVSAWISAWGIYIHSNTTVTLGRLGGVIGDNANHLIHHSNAPEHRNKNFAAFFPIWDRLFGTYFQRNPFPR